MTQYQRITGKVFGGNATATGNDPQIAQFGSALANTFVGTTDPETIQSLPAWGQGWIGAVTPDTQFPPLPEMTGAMKVLSHQICGILQQGVSTWDNGTIYYIGNFCSKNGIVYVSLTDENQGNDPETDTTNWRNYGGADIDLSNLSSKGQNIANWSTNVTNCITEIPQNIKLELNNGTLTLKAGSKLYKANGEAITINSDVNYYFNAINANSLITVYDSPINNMGVYIQGVNALSSPTAPATGITDTIWFDTTNNALKITHDNAVTWSEIPLPIAITSCTTADGITSIDQVFNGFGYIGSTIWVDKGVKGLIPNGRNEDGTLNNIEVVTNNVLTRTVANNVSVPITLFLNPTNTGLSIPPSSQVAYDEINNIIANNATGERYYSPQLATFDTTNGVVSNFQPKQPFRAPDIQDVVKKSGDTMTGNLTISRWEPSILNVQNLNLDYTSTTAPSSTIYTGGVNCYDKNNNITGSFRNRFHSSGTFQSQMIVRRNINGTNYEQNVSLGIYPDGTSSFVFPRCTTKATTTSSARNDLVAVVTQNYVNGASWYRVWSDGWIEQGGTWFGIQTITFLKSFANTNYTLTLGIIEPGNQQDNIFGGYRTVKSFTIGQASGSGGSGTWYACGY